MTSSLKEKDFSTGQFNILFGSVLFEERKDILKPVLDVILIASFFWLVEGVYFEVQRLNLKVLVLSKIPSRT